MSGPFDAYQRWLGIPPEEQPPNHYRLLGLDVFEDRAEIIEQSAERRTAHVRTFQVGPNAELCRKLLQEVAAARLCLLKPDKKADCSHGMVTRMAGKFVGVNPLTKSPVYQPTTVRIPCPTCRGSGWTSCTYCRNGQDKELLRSDEEKGAR